VAGETRRDETRRDETRRDEALAQCPAQIALHSLQQTLLELQMATTSQELLREAWLGGRKGNLSAREEARAWALREVWRADGKPDHGLNAYVAGKVVKVGGGNPQGCAIGKFFKKIDDDPDWFPGKGSEVTPGPDRALSATNRSVIARSATAMKDRGEEPTYAAVVAACPNATLNPQTQRPVDKKRVYDVFKEECYDDSSDPEDTWQHRARHTKTALPEALQELRLEWALWFLDLAKSAEWLFLNLVWTDICNSILPRSQKRHLKMVLARKGVKSWGSAGTQTYSKSLRGKREVLKQKSFDSIRVYWAPVLARGRLHLEVLGTEFPGEKVEGAVILAEKVRAALNIRFRGDSQPAVLFVDRGLGFWDTGTGVIRWGFAEALRANGLRTFYGDNASVQPSDFGDVLLHETAVAWVRRRETRTRTTTPWTETVEEFGVRLRDICQDINDTLDVEGLCRQLPRRAQELRDREGDRLSY